MSHPLLLRLARLDGAVSRCATTTAAPRFLTRTGLLTRTARASAGWDPIAAGVALGYAFNGDDRIGRRGAVQRVTSSRIDAGGKGINVTRMLRGSGAASTAVLPLDPSDPFGAVLRAADVPFTPVAVHGATRANLTLADADGVTTKINLPGVTRTSADGDALIDAGTLRAADYDWGSVAARIMAVYDTVASTPGEKVRVSR